MSINTTYGNFETRDALVEAVKAAQTLALNLHVQKGRKAAETKAATARRDALEEALIAYDTARQLGAGQVNTAPRATRLNTEARELKAALWAASQANNAAGVMRISKRLEAIYAEQDNGGGFI